MDVLRTYHSAVNGIEWYAQTLNDALQTQCVVLRIVPSGEPEHINSFRSLNDVIHWSPSTVNVPAGEKKRNTSMLSNP
ncbi:hypothetical protein TNCV_4263971 [Trichonephila clavipes]|nr:hypothetical protein TNCV_4263971 [Trichonephila clavipes]